jgi:hypothetical protein
VQQDLDAAREIQRSLLPQKLPDSRLLVGFRLRHLLRGGRRLPGHCGAARRQPADRRGRRGRQGPGFRHHVHQLPLGLPGMAVTGMPLDELATRMNQHHWAEGEEARRRYVTAIFLRLHPEAGEIEVVNAGHNPGFLVEPGAEPHQFEAAGTPLGFCRACATPARNSGFTRDAAAFLYRRADRGLQGDEEFGPERLLDEFSKCPAQKADGILDALWTALEEFSAGGPQGDDMTALALCRWTDDGDAGMSESKNHQRGGPAALADGLREGGHEHGASVAKLMGFREDRIEDLKTAVAEACINAIEHGNRLNEKLSVGVVLGRRRFAGSEGHRRRQGHEQTARPSRTSTARCTAKKIRAAWACSSSRRWWTRPSGWPGLRGQKQLCPAGDPAG